ncbi:MAG: tetratricopeptide repeat protein [Bacteroidales bacterium]|nr:tetratricopeptide repeat protein [Bacteroidales bacterium]MBR1950888.1 tetratricopeptide repeat protein [Bacteroidales bacterium]
MSTNKNVQEPEINVSEALSKTEKFFETYKNHIIYGSAAIIAIVAAVLLYHNFVTLPAQQEAMAQTFTAEQYFRNGDFEKALNGDGNALGFNQIISDYGTKSGEAVYFYAGICNLQLGNYDEAISNLKKYNGKDEILSARALACIGDAYAAMNNLESALSSYKSAAAASDNVLAANYLLKAGIICEEMGKPAEALKLYEEIKTKYSQSPEGYEINKYISRIQNAK